MPYKMLLPVLLVACASGDDSVTEALSDTSQEVGVVASTGPYFTTPMFWNYDISATPKAANSATVISSLKAAGGWGNGNIFQIDFSLNVLKATASTPKRSF